MIIYSSRPDPLWDHFVETLVASQQEPLAKKDKTGGADHLRIRKGILTGGIRRNRRVAQMAIETASQLLRAGLSNAIGLILFVTVLLGSAWAQKEVTADIDRYRGRELSFGSYQKYEYKPRPHLPFEEGQNPMMGMIAAAPVSGKTGYRKYLPDAHLGLEFYEFRTCISCHPRQARNLHTKRAKITCRQCHGKEPIAGINHYYTSMHPRRRHALVCAKCHKGSSPSFATYVIHEPSPAAMRTQRTFPVLFYAFWIMVTVAVGTFLTFLPLTILWGLREFFPDTTLWRPRENPVKGMKPNDQN